MTLHDVGGTYQIEGQRGKTTTGTYTVAGRLKNPEHPSCDRGKSIIDGQSYPYHVVWVEWTLNIRPRTASYRFSDGVYVVDGVEFSRQTPSDSLLGTWQPAGAAPRVCDSSEDVWVGIPANFSSGEKTVFMWASNGRQAGFELKKKGSLCGREVFPTQLSGFYMTPATSFGKAGLQRARPSTLDFLNTQTFFVFYHTNVANARLAGQVYQAACELERQVTQTRLAVLAQAPHFSGILPVFRKGVDHGGRRSLPPVAVRTGPRRSKTHKRML